MVKCKHGDRDVPGSIPGRCNSFVCFCFFVVFFCSFYFSVFFFFLFFFLFCFFFFDKKTENNGIQMLLDNMSSLKMRGL